MAFQWATTFYVCKFRILLEHHIVSGIKLCLRIMHTIRLYNYAYLFMCANKKCNNRFAYVDDLDVVMTDEA